MNDSLRLGGSSDHCSLPILTYLCPHVAQVHGSRLRLLQVSSADSGEYVCRVENGSGSKEASITVSVPHHTHSGPSLTSGEQSGRAGQGPPLGSPHYSQESCLWSLWGHQDKKGTQQALTLHSLLREISGLILGLRLVWFTWDPMMRYYFQISSASSTIGVEC